MRYQDLIEQHIEAFIQKQDSCLQMPIRKALTGGKRLRPILMMSWRELEGGNAEDVLDMALGVELIHCASCIHDDIIDSSTMRHNIPTLWVEYGLNMAICVGDILFSQALYLFQGRDREIVNNALTDLIIGQIEPEKPENYLRYYKKTSALFGAACEIGAIENKAPISQWGINFGIIYQALDDLMDKDGLCCISVDIIHQFLPLISLDNWSSQQTQESYVVLKSLTDKIYSKFVSINK